jgi:hypothetical protein
MLLHECLERPNLFRLIADEVERSQKRNDEDRRSKIVSSYFDAVSRNKGKPEFRQVRFLFDTKWGKGLDVTDYSMRKTLRSLRLPLKPGKPGRPSKR